MMICRWKFDDDLQVQSLVMTFRWKVLVRICRWKFDDDLQVESLMMILKWKV